MRSNNFLQTQDTLNQYAADVIAYAEAIGATSAMTRIAESHGFSVSVRRGATDTVVQRRDKRAGVIVYVGNKQGMASTSDFSAAALKDAVSAAYYIARTTAEDSAAGLAEDDQFERSPRDLQLYHPWALSIDDALEVARRAEEAAFAVSPQIQNSEGATVGSRNGHFVLATSNGFLGGYASSQHMISCAPLAGSGSHMQKDHWFTSERRPQDLASPESVGRYAAERAIARVQPRPFETKKVPVLLEAPLATELLMSFVQAATGKALFANASFLVDSLGKEIFAPHIRIDEDPHVPAAMGSAPFDAEGVRTRPRCVVKDGVIEGYFLSTYAARKLGMQSTGNADGPHGLSLRSAGTMPSDDRDGMLKRLGTGLLLTSMIGSGVNIVTGDYSRGAAGFWVENGEIQYPVEGITVASTLQQMFRRIVAIGNDTHTAHALQSGSVLIEEMTVAGR
ncbi:metallopeptidase TldD-related protein [Burkholderia stagnalis]|uniref:metallopeptidase TldD-related protein n=1 Tax=Burkholderia stagnalis TaxID=1503054 RepID=UPI0007573031|nr:metallopeptidase TldD-related protein [Burkholderia stagnalis]KVM88123.1 metalloprotease PmbA [Burkholderia stagnalis]KWE10568.1 metalloprotease PmbA [Burkholderia stagnalis]KWE18890.1 metalloprotease PmbA [Burkholderia stagnalis]KWO74051.1 metalloprotease PmbA [Burkholderia stagnalis]